MKQSVPTKKASFFRESALKVFPVLRQERTQSFAIVLLTFIALSIFGLFAINPTITTIIQLNKQLADNKFVYDKLQEKITNILSLQKQYNALQPDLSIVLSAIPDTYSIAQFMGKVQKLADDNKVKILSIQSNPLSIAPNNTKDGSISFLMTMQGDKQNILNFITKFMSFDRITAIDEVSLNTTSTNQSANVTQATIQAKAFFKPF